MKIFLVFFTTFLVSHVKASVPSDAFTFGFNVITHDMTNEREEKISQSVELLKVIFSSPEFRYRILNHDYKGEKFFAFNRGLSNRQIYQKILEGAETLQPHENNAMDVEIALFTDMDSNVLGYTKTLTKKIHMNTKYFTETTSPIQISAHLMHEWMHKLGFGHEKNHCENRKYSVPYAIGRIVKELAKEYDSSATTVFKKNFLQQWQSNDPNKLKSLLD